MYIELIVVIVIWLVIAVGFALLIKYTLSKNLTPGHWRLFLVLGLLFCVGSIAWAIYKNQIYWESLGIDKNKYALDPFMAIFIISRALAIWTIFLTIFLWIRAGFIKSKN